MSRAKVLLQKIQDQKPTIDIERSLYFTQSFKQTEGQALPLRWAKALLRYAQNASISIDEDQLIVGRASAKPGRYGILYPELDGNVLGDAVAKLPERAYSPFDIAPADALAIQRDIAPYWQGKTYHEALAQALSPETVKLTYNTDLSSRFIVNETSSFRSSIQWVHDYEIVLQKGLTGIQAELFARLNALDPDSPVDQSEKRPFIEALLLAGDAIILWANRYADLAEELAGKEKDAIRKTELRQIARICRHVPAYPARDFREAVQSQWFVAMFSRIEQKTGTVISNGRMDQFLRPFYERDIANGTITAAQAQELFECLWVQMAQFIDLYLSETGGAFNEGYAHWEAVTIGGQTPEGRDATNELTYLLLKSKRDFPLHYPDLAARIHTLSPKRYLREVAETIKAGGGFPKLINDEEVVPLLLAKGAKYDEALDYAVSGCSECRMPNRDTFTSPCAYINFAAALEITLFGGTMRKYGDEKIGLDLGDDFADYDAFLQAFLQQQTYFLRHAFQQQYHIIRLRARHFATPLGSILHKLCRENLVDLHQPHIPCGIDLGYFEYIGYATVVDSLAAIKKVIFEEKLFSLDELKAALRADFDGFEDLRQALIHAPKYGNDDDYADTIAQLLDRHAIDYTARYSHELGVHLDLRLVPFTSHVPFGKVVGATPNGRRAFTPLSDGSSASQGADINGPTAVLLSNFSSKNQGRRERASRLLNIKLSPACVAGESGTEKLEAFIESWRDLRLWHIQFNVLEQKTLYDAQNDPENHRDLLVRIAGYSAYFTQLTRDLQDDIIARTQHGWAADYQI
ncbi:MAG: glycyl radical protein [Oscillospiraceae bacterium]|jgi:formate C-acetyltransferase|nr:glycyl radical protein [Oscillospiraceae bacterium]